MIVGHFTSDREAVFQLIVRGTQERPVPLDAILDTGFTDFLTLPVDVIAAIAPTRLDRVAVTLADGSTTELEVYKVFVEWDGRERAVTAYGVEGTALIGIGLLYGSQVTLRVIDGGSAVIEALA